jgi:hypothetical protein
MSICPWKVHLCVCVHVLALVHVQVRVHVNFTMLLSLQVIILNCDVYSRLYRLNVTYATITMSCVLRRSKSEVDPTITYLHSTLKQTSTSTPPPDTPKFIVCFPAMHRLSLVFPAVPKSASSCSS